MKKPIKIIKNRSDIGAGTRGSDLGIDALEIAAINSNHDFFNRLESLDLETANASIYEKVNNTFAKRIHSVYDQCRRVSSAVADTIKNDYFPLILSGDHSSAIGSISGLKSAYPKSNLGVVWIDAHADIHSPYTSPTGNVHGMPLAALLANDNLPCKKFEINEETLKYWNALKNLDLASPKITAEDLVYFGVRDTEEPENVQLEKLKIKNYPVHEVRYRGLRKCVTEAMEKLAHCDFIYISFDVDSLDCDSVSYGTGTPVPKGFDPEEVVEIINLILESNKVLALELVEVNPLLDHSGNKMAETAFQILLTTLSRYL